MKILEYFLRTLVEETIEEPYDLYWYYTLFTILPTTTNDNKYFKIENGNVYTIRGELIEDVKLGTVFLSMTTPVTVEKNYLPNIKEAIETTVGRLIANKLVLSDNFGDIIPYVNGNLSIGKIEPEVARQMQADKISVKSYNNFVDACMFLSSFSRITTISSTPKGMLPPPGIDAYKKELVKKMIEKYGPDWNRTRAVMIEYEAELKAFDAKWLEDDPANGKLLSGKVKNDSRAKLFLAFGSEAAFDKKGVNPQLIDNSLLDGFPEDKEQLATIYNTSRSGSFDRGKETQKGGAAAKDILRATSAITIGEGDCGSTKGKAIKVTKDIADSLIGRYVIEGNKIKPIENPSEYVGKIITIRSPMYCKRKGSEFCAVCVGKVMAGYPNGISLVTTDVSGILLNLSMKTMHNSAAKTIKFNILDNIR